MWRLFWLLLAGLLFLPPAAAVELVEIPSLDEATRGLERLVVPRGEAPSLGEAVQRAVQPATPGPWQPGASAQGSAGPSPPAPLAEAAGRAALMWLLAAGGGASLVGLGWRHLHRRNVLDHPARLAILQLLRQQPGMHVRAIARATSQPVQQAAYHLRVLERLGLVASQSLAGRKCYHEAGVAPEVRRALLEAAMMPSPSARQVLAFIAAHPGASQSEVARQLGMLPGRARWHLRRLAEQGSLVEARQGKALTYRPRAPSSHP